ncbi:uncharacterized protein LOC114760686 [Neltuma alba]|uniref:uncharacterized protein LOC114760686 n=1 Tax=Neltuma alba TaxID=207710 RepID=UPI0010A32B32|nr:uncharacterized protein LOC114760686 [Prosopis alba]
MLGRPLTLPAQSCCAVSAADVSLPVDLAASPPAIIPSNTSFSSRLLPSVTKAAWAPNVSMKNWMIHSAQIDDMITSKEYQTMWEASRQALATFDFSVEEKDKILGKAFGLVNSPYWGEEREKEVPKFETVNGVLEYLRSLSLSDDDLAKLLKKFPEVLGCSLEDELKTNVKILEKEWGIEGKSLRNLLLRNPKVLGYNVDCKGDCMAQCTRCWVRF